MASSFLSYFNLVPIYKVFTFSFSFLAAASLKKKKKKKLKVKFENITCHILFVLYSFYEKRHFPAFRKMQVGDVTHGVLSPFNYWASLSKFKRLTSRLIRLASLYKTSVTNGLEKAWHNEWRDKWKRWSSFSFLKEDILIDGGRKLSGNTSTTSWYFLLVLGFELVFLVYNMPYHL